jgi:MscS family membrane protein
MTHRLVLALLCSLITLTAPRTLLAQDATPSDPASAQADTKQPDERLDTPESAMFTYLAAMERFAADKDQAALDEALLCFNFAGVSDRALQREFAIKMLQVLNRISLVDSSDFLTYFTNPDGDRFVYFPQDRIPEHRRVDKLTDHQIVFESNTIGEWRFSDETVAELNALYRDIEHLPADFGATDAPVTPSMVLRAAVPVELRRAPVLDIEIWQWIAIAVVIFVGFLLDLLVRAILRAVWHRINRKRDVEEDREVTKKAVRPFGLVAGAFLWYWSLHLLGLPAVALMVLLVAVRVIAMVAAVWAAFRLVDLVGSFLTMQASKTDTKLDDLLIPLVRKTAKVFIAAFGLVYIAESFDIEVLPLLTGLGIGGLAVAFAAKDTIENFFGSIAVIVDQPFEVGDWIKVGDTEGTVEHLGLRSTRVRTFYNSLVTVPNAMLVRATVDNFGRRRYRRFSTHIGVTYDTPPDTIEAFCEGIREIVRLHPYTRKDTFHIWLNKWGPSSLDIMIYIFHECPDWGTELRERQRFMLDVMRLAEKMGVSFAFPTQTIEFKNTDLAEPDAPLPMPQRDTEMTARQSGIHAARELTGLQPWRDEAPPPVVFSGADLHDQRGSAGDGEG